MMRKHVAVNSHNIENQIKYALGLKDLEFNTIQNQKSLFSSKNMTNSIFLRNL